MPQLDISFFFSQIGWLLLSFCAFFCVVKFLLLPRLEKIIDNRRVLINNNIDFAEDIMKKVEEITDENNKKINEAKEQGNEKIDAFVKQLEQKNESEMAKIIRQNNEDIQRHIIQERAKMVKLEDNIRQSIVEIAKNILKNVYAIESVDENELEANCKKSFVLKQE